VYHASYLRFMERGRTNYLRLLGADQRALFEETEKEAPGFAFVVRSMQIEFRKAARMDDVLEVTTTPHEVRGASITLDQRIMRACWWRSCPAGARGAFPRRCASRCGRIRSRRHKAVGAIDDSPGTM
jgi:YbgC/YbaW family acyl-CoA thioester hydrolase